MLAKLRHLVFIHSSIVIHSLCILYHACGAGPRVVLHLKWCCSNNLGNRTKTVAENAGILSNALIWIVTYFREPVKGLLVAVTLVQDTRQLPAPPATSMCTFSGDEPSESNHWLYGCTVTSLCKDTKCNNVLDMKKSATVNPYCVLTAAAFLSKDNLV